MQRTAEITSDEAHIGLIGLFLIIFIEGFVSISVEILTIRQLIPVVGNNVVVTSIIIGMFLLFLAIGYYRGGYYREDYQSILVANFARAAVLLGVGLSYVFINILFMLMTHFLASNQLVSLVIYLFVVTAPLIYILGQTVPITTNLVRHEHHVGAISGTVLSISTLGSFLGAVATAVILLNFFGVAWTVVINYMALSLIVILLVFQRKKQWILIPILVIASVIIYMMNVNFEKKQFILTNQYSDYMLLNNYEHPVMGKGKLFIVNASPSSFLTQENKAFPYAEMVKHILFNKLKLTNKEILVIGAGGFSLSAEGTNGNQFYYNDIDSDMAKAAKSGFVKKINGTFIPGDARPFLKYNTKKFDVIISDAFNSRQSIPFYLLTQEHMRNIKKAINPGGYAMFNIIANPTFSTSYSKRVDNTIRSVFKNCVAIPVDYANKPTNIVYVCYMAKNTGDTTIYTDDKNSVSLDFYRR